MKLVLTQVSRFVDLACKILYIIYQANMYVALSTLLRISMRSKTHILCCFNISEGIIQQICLVFKEMVKRFPPGLSRTD